MLEKLRKRLRNEEKGFTLIELLVVMIILGILTAIAVPSYLSFRDRANKSAAAADVRAIVPSIESYFADNGTYATMTLDLLKTNYDQAIDTTTYVLGSLGASTYCVQATSGDKTAAKAGPAAKIVDGTTCP
jgi:type IV pilus assembly protein PilA